MVQELNREEWGDQSTQLECPKCHGFVYINAYFSPDAEFGDVICVEAYCPTCKDQRVDQIAEDTYKLWKLVAKIGT